MKDILGIIVNNPCISLAMLTEHRNPLTLPFFARYRLMDFELSNMVNSAIGKVGIIASDKYRSLLDHVGAGQEWDLSRKSRSLIILQGSRRISNVNQRDINLMDFEINHAVFDRNQMEDVIIASPNIVSSIDYSEFVDAHRGWGADITFMGTKTGPSEHKHDGLYLKADDNGFVKDMNVGESEDSTHLYAGKLIIKKETLFRLMHMAHELGEYELFTLIMENLDNLDIRCYTYEGYLRRVASIKEFYDVNLELINTEVSAQLFDKERIIYTKAKDNHPTLYKDTCKVRKSAIASGGIIHGEVYNSVLFRQVIQEKNSSVKNSILMEGCHIGEGTELEYVIADRNVVIGKNVILKGTKDSPVVLKKEMII